MNEKMFKPINVFVKFPLALEPLVGQGEMKLIMNDGASFVFLLHSIFTSYPGIQKRYPPGKLAFTLNNRKPTEYEPLHDGDKVAFFV